MIMPSRWLSGGRGLNEFRDEMLKDHRLVVLHDYLNAQECFSNVELKGGVCYLLWDNSYDGSCDIYTHMAGSVENSRRYLDQDEADIFIRSVCQKTILEKIQLKNEPSLFSIIRAGRFFGFHTKLTWSENGLGELQTANGKSSFPVKQDYSDLFNVKVYVHGGVCYIERNNVTKNQEFIDTYKVLLPRSGNPASTVIGKPIISEPGSCSSNSYSVVVPDKGFSEIEAGNFVRYCKTKFFRLLVQTRSYTQMLSPSAYEFVPIQDFAMSWADEELYKKYELTEEEIAFIENTIPPMA